MAANATVTWQSSYTSPGPLYQSAFSVSCATTTYCASTGGATGAKNLLVSNGSDSNFKALALPTALQNVQAVSCPATRHCVVGSSGPGNGAPSALGAGVTSSTGSTTWTSTTLPTGDSVNALSCIKGTTFCAVLLANYAKSETLSAVSTNGGAKWSTPAVVATSSYPTTLSCAKSSTVTACYAVITGSSSGDAKIARNTKGGAGAWSVSTVENWASTHNWLTSISCPGVTNCFAVGGSGSSTKAFVLHTANGTGWSADSSVPTSGISYLRSISCFNTSDCLAAGASPGTSLVTVKTTNGGTFTSAKAPFATGQAQSTSCPSSTVCIVSGVTAAYSIQVATTSTDGGAWSEAAMPAGGYILGVSCVGSGPCVAGGIANGARALSVYKATGTSSYAASMPAGLEEIDAVSCFTSTSCLATARSTAGTQEILASTNGGATWTLKKTLAASPAPGLLVCVPGSTTCFMTFSSPTSVAIKRSTDSGATWASVAAPSGITYFKNLTCSTATQCVAVGPLAAFYSTDGGTSWHAPSGLPGSGTIGYAGGSCNSTGDCLLLGSSGTAYSSTDGGSAWAAATVPSGLSQFIGVSCSSGTTCTTAGVTSAGVPESATSSNLGASGTWGSNTTLPGMTSSSYLAQLSCGSSGLCAVIGVLPNGDATMLTLH